MKYKNITFSSKGKKFKIKAKVLSNAFQEAIGLTFTPRKKAQALLFKLKKPMAIHSCFVFFPFVAIWLDKNNKVVEIKKIQPFTLHVLPKKSFDKIIEIPINKKYSRILSNLCIQ
jgi:uncharacterized membrane protein (UPF0127 family)